ncbi:MAG: hypothetical protein H0T67_03615 [Burkholderiaceae bacterium]|nr:hypothetical protein [Burkholderiaceae bacterium]
MHWQAVETTPIRIGAPVPRARADAIGDALLKRAVPLSRLDQGRLQPLATAGLVRDGDRVGLVTAAHIFERAHWGDLAVPLPRDGRVAPLHSARIRLAMHPDNDVAILWIGDRSLAQRLRTNWETSSTVGVTMTRSTPSSHVLVGYPACNARRIDGCVYTKPLVLFTESIDAERYLYARTAERMDGVTIWTPELDGVSGAMLWSISDEEDDDVACVLRLAAIQVAFTHNAHLRAEPITCVLELLQTSRPQ